MSDVSVMYALNQTGNLDKSAPKLADDLDKVADAADDAKTKVDDLNKSGQSFSARAIEVGSATLEMAGAVFEGVKAFIEGAAAAKEWMDSVVELRKQLIAQGRATEDATKGIVEYEAASKRLTAALEELQLTVGEELSGAFTEALNAGTGLLTILGDLSEGAADLAPDFDTLVNSVRGVSPLLGAVLSTGGALFSTAAVVGESQLPGDPGGFMGPTPEQLDEIARLRREQGAAARGDVEFGFGIPGTIEELEAQVFGELFEQWLAEPAEALTQAAETVEVETVAAMSKANAAIDQVMTDVLGSLGSAAGTLVPALGTGSISGVLGVAGAGDPLTTLVMEVIGLLRDPQPIFDIFSEVLETYADLDQWVAEISTGIVDLIIANLPEMAAAFTVIGPAVALALVDAAPQLFAAVIEALFELPKAFAEAIAGTILQAGDALNPFNDGAQMLNPFRKGGALATHFGEGSDSFLGIGLGTPSLDTGGSIQSDGLAYVHRGEVVLNQEQQRAVGGTSIGAIHVHMHGVQDMRRFAEELQNALGPYGINLSLSPRVG